MIIAGYQYNPICLNFSATQRKGELPVYQETSQHRHTAFSSSPKHHKRSHHSKHFKGRSEELQQQIDFNNDHSLDHLHSERKHHHTNRRSHEQIHQSCENWIDSDRKHLHTKRKSHEQLNHSCENLIDSERKHFDTKRRSHEQLNQSESRESLIDCEHFDEKDNFCFSSSAECLNLLDYWEERDTSPQHPGRSRGRSSSDQGLNNHHHQRSSSAPAPSHRRRKRHSIAEDCDETMKNLSFCGCGFLGMYHMGVVSCLIKHGPGFIAQLNRVAGASAGALAAAVLVTMPQVHTVEVRHAFGVAFFSFSLCHSLFLSLSPVAVFISLFISPFLFYRALVAQSVEHWTCD